jgi:uncharacterized protein YabN with tetrapyrrole methylase and pyrophosphatase domain
MTTLIPDLRSLLYLARKVTEAHQKRVGKRWLYTDQICHMHKEVCEVHDGIHIEAGPHRVACELWDVIFSALAFGHIYGLSDDELLDAMTETLEKIQAREGLLAKEAE